MKLEHTLLIAGTAVLMLLASTPGVAKLPAPGEEVKAKAAEAAAKAAHGNKVANYQLCKSMDKLALTYQAQAKRDGKAVNAADPSAAACAEPGAFVYTPPPAVTAPLEAAGAHSPPATAVGPPNTKAPQAAAPAKP